MKMMVVLFLAVAASFVEVALCQLSTYYHNTGMDDVVFQHSLLFDQPVRSLLECATRCAEDGTCVTFTLVMQPSGDVSCRGHSLEMDPASPTGSSGNSKAKTYVMTDTKGGECACNPCQNGGTCTYQANAYTCTCPAGYGGINCESGTDECSSNPCQNGGTCRNHANVYTCTCPPSYTGTECQQDMDPCEPGSYTTLDNQERNIMSRSVVSLGDDVLPAGWYRFKLNGGNAMIPNVCTRPGKVKEARKKRWAPPSKCWPERSEVSNASLPYDQEVTGLPYPCITCTTVFRSCSHCFVRLRMTAARHYHYGCTQGHIQFHQLEQKLM